jgi:hypothetical protein
MDATTLRHAADTVTETVAERLTDLTDTAHRLAAKTPWIEPPPPRFHLLRTLAMGLVALAALGIVGWWLAKRRTETAGYEPRSEMGRPTEAERRLTAAAG